MQKRLGNLILLKIQNLKTKNQASFENKPHWESELVSVRLILKGRVIYCSRPWFFSLWIQSWDDAVVRRPRVADNQRTL